jgi:hypothetical protein
LNTGREVRLSNGGEVVITPPGHLRYSLPCGARKSMSVGERDTDSRRLLRVFIHFSSIIRNPVFSPRNLLLTLALRSHTRSSLLHCRCPLCLLTQHSEAFRSSFSLTMLEQLDHVASTGLVQVENQGKGHVGHRCGSSGGYWSSVTISLTRRQSSVPRSVQIPAPQ